MFFNFYLYEIAGLPLAIAASYATNAIFILAYSWIFKSELSMRAIPVTFALVPLDFITYNLHDAVYAYTRTFAGTVLICSAISGLLLGFTSTFAFVRVNRKHLVASWVVADIISAELFPLPV